MAQRLLIFKASGSQEAWLCGVGFLVNGNLFRGSLPVGRVPQNS